jgi:hypothetical protein
MRMTPDYLGLRYKAPHKNEQRGAKNGSEGETFKNISLSSLVSSVCGFSIDCL